MNPILTRIETAIGTGFDNLPAAEIRAQHLDAVAALDRAAQAVEAVVADFLAYSGDKSLLPRTWLYVEALKRQRERADQWAPAREQLRGVDGLVALAWAADGLRQLEGLIDDFKQPSVSLN